MASKLFSSTLPSLTFVIFAAIPALPLGWMVEIFISSPISIPSFSSPVSSFAIFFVKCPFPSDTSSSKSPYGMPLLSFLLCLKNLPSILLSWVYFPSLPSRVNTIGEFNWAFTILLILNPSFKVLNCLSVIASLGSCASAMFVSLEPPKSTPSFLKLTFLPFPPIELMFFSSVFKV